MATTRQQIDSRGNGILELLDENRGVSKVNLGELKVGDIPEIHTNRYHTQEDSLTYNQSFSKYTLDYYYPPDNNEFSYGAANGFNLGQVLGPDPSIQNSLMNKGKEIAKGETFVMQKDTKAGNPFIKNDNINELTKRC